MKLYRYNTPKLTLFFPKINEGEEFLYNLFYAHRSAIDKLTWRLFLKHPHYRALHRASSERSWYPLQNIIEIEEKGSKMAFSVWRRRPFESIYIAGLEPTGRKFFGKFATSELSRSRLSHEVTVMRNLTKSGLVPELYDYTQTVDHSLLKMEYMTGQKWTNNPVNENLVNYLIKLSEHTLEVDKNALFNGKRYCLSHGSCSPWNVVDNGERICMVNWENAADRPLGYDLVHYIVHIYPGNTEPSKIDYLHKQMKWIKMYYHALGVEDWTPYVMSCLSLYRASLSTGDRRKSFLLVQKIERYLQQHLINNEIVD